MALLAEGGVWTFSHPKSHQRRCCVKSLENRPTSDRGLSFLECAAPCGGLSLEWAAALSLGVVTTTPREQKRRHPFERQRTTRGGALQIKRSFQTLDFSHSICVGG